ncbi:MAG: hypothetical protein ACO3V0_05960 [Ilumatobacteraceae bacterium]|nr:hypothetical protein [Ilumatobacteraceae bacterium]MBL6759398.1 hypothetical protein [Ilumatobacteraceae bacterium]MDA0202616.1 hypothetical protein [Actinomycetota bacterium]MDA2973784.1 hypothetical protein [Actinomycetota bacterium]MDA3010143.1 hypothetical protein [Actinomycetota bacterium]
MDDQHTTADERVVDPMSKSTDTQFGWRQIGARVAVLTVMVAFAAFWTWALFFASKEAVNRIGDVEWAERAEAVCQDWNERRLELADYRQIREGGADLIRERADIIDRATDMVESMIAEVNAVRPSDEKGRAIVPLWTDEYATYIEDRRRYAAELRATGENLPFYETMSEVPLSERLETFAGDNRMDACAPPRDLSM